MDTDTTIHSLFQSIRDLFDGTLSRNERLVVLLKHAELMTTAEIGQTLDLDADEVAVMLDRAMHKLADSAFLHLACQYEAIGDATLLRVRQEDAEDEASRPRIEGSV